MREFRSRVRAALRRAEMSQVDGTDEPLQRGDLHIDFAKRTTELADKPVQLTYVEFEILSVLARHPGRVYTRDMLLDRIWGDSAFRDQRTIDVHIRHLREKLERDPRNPEYLLTVRGVGYRFRDE
jgi:DNA-binding response OmpR family regulator